MTLAVDQLAYKIQWEGGVLDAIEYGIKADEIEDVEIRALWDEVETGYRRLWPLIHEIEMQIGARLKAAKEV